MLEQKFWGWWEMGGGGGEGGLGEEEEEEEEEEQEVLFVCGGSFEEITKLHGLQVLVFCSSS
jgi:hypothetical protein